MINEHLYMHIRVDMGINDTAMQLHANSNH